MWVMPSAMAAFIWESMSLSELPRVMGPCKVTIAVASGKFSMVALSGISKLYLTRGVAGRNVSATSRTDRGPYFHSQTLETVPPLASTSYSNAPQALLSLASFFDVVWKNSMPR